MITLEQIDKEIVRANDILKKLATYDQDDNIESLTKSIKARLKRLNDYKDTNYQPNKDNASEGL